MRRRTFILWRCTRCGFGVFDTADPENEPGNCGCWTPGDGWDYERIEVWEKLPIREALESVRAHWNGARRDGCSRVEIVLTFLFGWIK